MIAPYNVACIQTAIRQVRDPATRDETVRENLYRSISLMEYAAIRFGQPKLVVLPEFYLTGADHLRRTIREWTEVACRIPGPETDALGRAAQELKMYIAGGTMEYDPEWPNRWFNSAFSSVQAGTCFSSIESTMALILKVTLPIQRPPAATQTTWRNMARTASFPSLKRRLETWLVFSVMT